MESLEALRGLRASKMRRLRSFTHNRRGFRMTEGCEWARLLAATALIGLVYLVVCGERAAGQGAATGSVTGKVVQEPGGQGIRKVIVELVQGEEGETGKEYRTATDAAGVFRFEGVEAGKYAVDLSRAGFFPAKKNGPEWTVTVEAGKEVAELVYKMRAAGVITGRIVDGDGDPLANAGVKAILQGKPALGSARQAGVVTVDGGAMNHALTNDLGEYRIADLEPGQYEVQVDPPLFLGPAPNPADRGKQREKVLFTKTYYPGTMEEGQAGTVQVTSGGTATANVTLLTNRAYRVSGTVSGASGAQMEQIILVSRSSTQLQQNVEEGGKFEFQNVQPGTYEARVVLVVGVGEGQRPTMKVEMVKAPIVVEGADVTGLDLVPEAGGTIRGKFRMEDGTSIDWTQLTVRLEPVAESGAGGAEGGADTLGNLQSYGAGVEPDGSFEIADVPGGTYQLAVAVKSEIYRDHYVKSVMESGREVADTGFAATGGAALEVVVSANGATIDRTVLNAEGKPATNAEVIAVPATGMRMRPDAYQVEKTNGQGHYTLRGMNPGQYVLVALEGAHEDARSAAFATKYGAVGEPVDLGEGEKKTVGLRVTESKE